MLLALLAVDRKFGAQRPRGLLGGMFFLLYFTGRFTVEFFKDFQPLDAHPSTLTMGQYLSIPFMLLGTVWILYSLKKKHPTTIISS